MNIKSLTKLTGLTSKTLRHWESVGLLLPTREENDYRSYSDNDLTKIFYITSLRQLDLPLSEIKIILENSQNEKTTLENHLERLRAQQEKLEKLIKNLNQKLEKGDYKMTTTDFEHFKQETLKKNEKNYGEEIRSKYGVETVDKANRKFLAQSEEGTKWASETHEKIVRMLEDAYVTKDNQLAQEAVKLHKSWLEFYWPHPVTAEAHIGLGQMYCDDERFRANYNQKYEDLPEFFYDSIKNFYGL